ncbi:MAG: Uma2 family endonuclease [Bacillota bacterium]|jgi:Uma2 family endonuclease
MKPDGDLITAQALAEALSLSVETVWRYTRENKIPFLELGARQYRYRLSDVLIALSGSQMRERGTEYKASDKKLTYQDYVQMPEEPGYRLEILDGILIKEPSPTVVHQRVSRRLQRVLEDYFAVHDPNGEVFNAPLDVTLGDYTVVQPDIFYIAGGQEHLVLRERVEGPPTLVVEVLSPTSRRKDRWHKLQIYQRAEVPHYWMVDPEEHTLECFSLRDGVYALVVGGVDDDVVEHPELSGLVVHLEQLW